MFRKAIFALILVGAAFAGGAAINGPGLAWLQRNFAGSPSIIVDQPSSPSRPTGKPPKSFPSVKTPPLQAGMNRREPPRPQAKADLTSAEPPLPPESPSTPASALTRLPEVALNSAPTPPSTPADTIPPLEFPGDPSTTPTSSPIAIPPKTDPVARLASATTALEPDQPPATALTPTRDWLEIRKRLKAQGIVRYTIEAETDGRVRFTCVIPVDGLRAVGHHFEAEGDDEYQAVDALLKRIALWKATQE